MPTQESLAIFRILPTVLPAHRRSVSVHEHEALLRAAKQFQRTEEFHALYRQRSTVEHRIARLIQLGLRQARYFGTANTLFQLAMVAAVANFTLVAASGANALSVLSLLRPFVLLTLAIFVLGSTSLMLNAQTNSCPKVHAPQDRLFKSIAFRLGF